MSEQALVDPEDAGGLEQRRGNRLEPAVVGLRVLHIHRNGGQVAVHDAFGKRKFARSRVHLPGTPGKASDSGPHAPRRSFASTLRSEDLQVRTSV